MAIRIICMVLIVLLVPCFGLAEPNTVDYRPLSYVICDEQIYATAQTGQIYKRSFSDEKPVVKGFAPFVEDSPETISPYATQLFEMGGKLYSLHPETGKIFLLLNQDGHFDPRLSALSANPRHGCIAENIDPLNVQIQHLFAIGNRLYYSLLVEDTELIPKVGFITLLSGQCQLFNISDICDIDEDADGKLYVLLQDASYDEQATKEGKAPAQIGLLDPLNKTVSQLIDLPTRVTGFCVGEGHAFYRVKNHIYALNLSSGDTYIACTLDSEDDRRTRGVDYHNGYYINTYDGFEFYRLDIKKAD